MKNKGKPMIAFQKSKSTLSRFQLFIKNAHQKHGELYDYTLSEQDYMNTRSHIRIGCKQCGLVFKTLPQDHTAKNPHRKGGCPTCIKPSDALKKAIQTRWSSNYDDRIKQYRMMAEFKHKNAYIYPFLDSEYLNEKSVITIQCKQCSHEFKSQARIHASKDRYGGCAVCNKEKMKQTIAEKNKMRQTHNYQSKNLPVPVGHIYQITNSTDGNTYVGYTTMGLKERFKAHIDSSKQVGKNGYKSKSYLHNAIRKHGAGVFEIKSLLILTNVTPQYLADRETEFIKDLNPYYNLTEGGDMWGPTCTKPKPVDAYDLEENFIGSYRSMAHAAKSVNGDPIQIRRACMEKRPYKNCMWQFVLP